MRPPTLLAPVAFALLVFVPACGTRPALMSPPAAGTHTGAAQTPEEKAVEDYLRQEAKGYKEFKILEWGPHDLTGQTHFHDPAKRKILRVKFQARLEGYPLTTSDDLFTVDKEGDGFRVGPMMNGHGDRWLEKGIEGKRVREKAANGG